MARLGFLRFLAGRARWHLQNLRGIHDVTQRAQCVEIRQGTTIINPHLLECGDGLRVESGCFLHCGGNPWSGGKGRIKLGKRCSLGQNNVLYGAGGIDIGDHIDTGPGVMIFSSRDDYSREHALKDHVVHQFGQVTIGSHVIIFSGAIIGPGVTIGDGAVIGAGSVVLKDVPAWTVSAGVPARVLGDREEDRPLECRQLARAERVPGA